MNPVKAARNLLGKLKRDPVSAVLVSLVEDSAVYLTGGVLIGLGSLILMPLYTRCLPPREFGVYALVDVTVLLLVTVTSLKLDVSYLKWFADLGPSQRGDLLGSTLLIGFAASALGGLALSLAVASDIGQTWLHASGRGYAWMLFPIIVLENLQLLFLTDLRARRRAVSYSAAAIIRLVGLVAASYYLLGTRQMGLPGLFLGRLAGDGLAFLVLGATCLPSVVFKISSSLLRPMLRFGLPLIWSVFTVMFQDASGRYFLSRYGSLEQVGLLGAAIKIGAVFQMLVSVPFGVAWGGVLFQIVKERDAQVIYSMIFRYVYVLSFGVALVLTILASTLFRLLTAPGYYSAVAILPFVLLVRAMSVIEQPASTGIYLAGRTELLAVSYTAALGVNLLLLRLLVPHFGLTGVGYAWLVGSAIVPFLFLIFGQRRYHLSLRPKLLLAPILLWIVVLPLRPLLESLWPGHPILSQSGLSLATLFVMGVVISFDFRTSRRQLHQQRLSSPILEVSSR
jgi:O-antigen/teichoic acid export membrane protein